MTRALLTLCLLAVGCDEDPTQIVVVVRSNLEVPAELDAFDVALFAAGEATETRTFELAPDGPYELPASFGIAPGDGGRQAPVHVVVAGHVGGVQRVTAEVRTGFVRGRTVRVDVFLGRECVDVPCDEIADTTCRAGRCEEVFVDPAGLPDYTPGDEAAPFDAGAPSDAGHPDGGAPDGGPLERTCPPFEGWPGPLEVSEAPVPCTDVAECEGDEVCEADRLLTQALCSRACRLDSECVGIGPEICHGGGRCARVCDPLTHRGCPDGLKCSIWLSTSDAGNGCLFHYTFCRIVSGVGGEQGAPCGTEAGQLLHEDCATAYSCVNEPISDTETANFCRRHCTDGGGECDDLPGMVCQTFPTKPILLSTGERIGLCVPG